MRKERSKMTTTRNTKRYLERCYACPYAQWQAPEDDSTEEPKLYCDPPMGECPAEQLINNITFPMMMMEG